MAEVFGGQDKGVFIERLRKAQRRRNRIAPPEPYPTCRDVVGEEDIDDYEQRVGLFIEAIQSVGGHVKRVVSPDAGYAVVLRELQQRGIRHVLLGRGDGSPGPELMLEEADIRWDRWDDLSFEPGSADRSVEAVDRWGAGIDWADYGIAELGSIAITASEIQSRTVSLLPPFHIAFLPGERLFTRRRSVLAHVAQKHKEDGRPVNLTFITGPSRSADIEMDLSIGVHGPGETLVVVIDPA